MLIVSAGAAVALALFRNTPRRLAISILLAMEAAQCMLAVIIPGLPTNNRQTGQITKHFLVVLWCVDKQLRYLILGT